MVVSRLHKHILQTGKQYSQSPTISRRLVPEFPAYIAEILAQASTTHMQLKLSYKSGILHFFITNYHFLSEHFRE